MKTTLRIDERLYCEVRAAATRQGITITRFVADALRLKLHATASVGSRVPVMLPTFGAGAGFPYSPRELRKLIQR